MGVRCCRKRDTKAFNILLNPNLWMASFFHNWIKLLKLSSSPDVHRERKCVNNHYLIKSDGKTSLLTANCKWSVEKSCAKKHTESIEFHCFYTSFWKGIFYANENVLLSRIVTYFRLICRVCTTEKHTHSCLFILYWMFAHSPKRSSSSSVLFGNKNNGKIILFHGAPPGWVQNKNMINLKYYGAQQSG